MVNRSSDSHADFLIVICHALYSPWIEILNEGQLKTWATPEESKIVHIFGHPVPGLLRKIDIFYWNLKWSTRWGKVVTAIEYLFSPLINRNIPNVHDSRMSSGAPAKVVEMPDFNFLMNKKTLAVLNFGSQLNFKHIVFTTSSSYINIKVLHEALLQLPTSNMVAGRLVERNGAVFPSGSFRVFSPDVLVSVLENLGGYKYWLPEDLAIGKVLSKLNVDYFNIESLDLSSAESIENLTQDLVAHTSHYRLKSEFQGKRNDVALMRKLHLKIINGKKQ